MQRRLGRTPPATVPVEHVFPMAAPLFPWVDTVTDGALMGPQGLWSGGPLALYRLDAVQEAPTSPALGVDEPLSVLVRQLFEGLEEVA